MSLENRVAVITGATGGLGWVVARRLAEEGACVALVSSNSYLCSDAAGMVNGAHIPLYGAP